MIERKRLTLLTKSEEDMKDYNDKFSNLSVSGTRKWQLRHPDRQKKLIEKYQATDKYKEIHRHSMHKINKTILNNCRFCKI